MRMDYSKRLPKGQTTTCGHPTHFAKRLCKKCYGRCHNTYPGQRKRRLMKAYGMTEQQYFAIVAAQGGGCAICGRRAGKKHLVVDHDHKTGKVRGILCSPCNVGLGNFQEMESRLDSAINYLRSWRVQQMPIEIVDDGLGGD